MAAWPDRLNHFLGHYPHVIAALTAVSTLAAVIVSLCLAFAARRANKPGLRILPDGFSGNIVTHQDNRKARYYLLRVANPRRTIRSAHDVQLLFTRIEKSGSHGPEILFDEIMPVGWIRQELYTLPTRIVGPDAQAALFYVQEDGLLEFTPARPTATHFPLSHQSPVTLWVTLQAVSIEADSPPIRLKIMEWAMACRKIRN
jgi:hypothetical protein